MSKKLVSLLLAFAMLMTMGIGAFAEEATTEETTSTPLVVGYDTFSGKFSSFYGDTGYDNDVANITQISMLTTDRMGGIIYNAIEGETVAYNGTDYTYTGPADVSVKYDETADKTTYTIKLRDDLKFSDGEPVTADDIIFNYYVFLDPAYVGSITLNSYDIVGLQDYRTQTTSSIYDKYNTVAAAIYAAGMDHEWSADDAWTEEQQTMFWDLITTYWKNVTAGITSYVGANYLSDDYAPTIGSTVDEISANEGLQVAFGMAMWGFASYEEGILTGTATGTTWDLANGVYPTNDDYYTETYTAYAGDADAFSGTEDAGTVYSSTVTQLATNDFITAAAKDEPELADGVPNISGITKLDDYTVQVVTNGYEAPAVYSICGLNISPMHYYGDPAQYDYENNQFGHPYGDLSMVEAKTGTPLGAGPYKFVKYENRVVYFEANELFYKGAPKTKYMQWKETQATEVAAGVATGTIDMGELSGTKANFEAVAGYNSNGEITGDVVSTAKVDNLGYGYIGINADTVNVGGEPDSDASKDLRKALATVIAVYRDVAFDSYYGDAASVINYPISNTSWAAPQPTDEDYKVAFSVDVDGNDIYTSDMSADDKYAVALETAKNYLIAAGYTFDEASGVFTAAPEGASLSYELLIPGDGQGDHPSFSLVTDASKALATIGITLKINDPADSNELWDALDAGTQNLWCAAWSATIDPDMYQTYHSSNIVGLGGSDSNHYHIQDPTLDAAILDARQSDDQAFRKATYKTCLDIIVDWAVEIPCYQRQNCTIFSTQRIKMDTVTPDITTFWLWQNDIQNVEMAA